MPLHIGNPAALAACGAPVTDLAGASITSDNSHSTLALQACRLVRLYAGIVFGKVSR